MKSGTKSEPDITANAGAGIAFLTISNDDYGNGMWPEDVNNRPAYLSDFRAGTIEKSSLPTLIENGEGLSYVAKTATYDAATGLDSTRSPFTTGSPPTKTASTP